jgi:hypothetical protein
MVACAATCLAAAWISWPSGDALMTVLRENHLVDKSGGAFAVSLVGC